MKQILILATLFTFFAGPSNAQIEMTIGDGLIDGERVEPYSSSWRQCTLQDGEWLDMGTITEELVVIGPVIRHRQIGHQSGGIRVQSDTYFERSTFAPLRMETEASRDGERVMYSVRQLTETGYTGVEVRGDVRKELAGIISSVMLPGSLLGLPLATMAYHEEPVTFLASMAAFDGTYEISAQWVGTETMLVDSEEIAAWMIDVEWRHRESGDVYPPGPDGSGGRYWVVSEPPPGVPYVPRYQTDTYAVEFVTDTCPASD